MKLNLKLFIKSAIVLISVTLLSINAFAKNDTLNPAHNILFGEIAGTGGYGSINYERIFPGKNQFTFGIRIGLSSYRFKDYLNTFNPDIIIPFSVNAYYGAKHKVQVGIGQTLANIVHADFDDFKPARYTDVHSTFQLGYRYKKRPVE